MKTMVWLTVSATLLIASQLQAEDSGYDNRQFTINPGNMMNGMFNPMNSFFSGSDRYPNDYYNYRYAPPPAYPPAYGYPGAGYGYPPAHPGYQAPPRTGGYPTPAPAAQQPQPSTANAQPAPPAAHDQASPVHSGYAEKYRFRPLDANEPAANNSNSATNPQDSAPPPVYPSPPPVGQAAAPLNPHSADGGYGPGQGSRSSIQESQMKFRPLDKPGYVE
ncbi:MAG: hypothetical protein AB2598_04805 [Candidatus Thiodiazotropha sp.]